MRGFGGTDATAPRASPALQPSALSRSRILVFGRPERQPLLWSPTDGAAPRSGMQPGHLRASARGWRGSGVPDAIAPRVLLRARPWPAVRRPGVALAEGPAFRGR